MLRFCTGKARETLGKMMSNAEQLGVKLVGAWIDAQHRPFILLLKHTNIVPLLLLTKSSTRDTLQLQSMK